MSETRIITRKAAGAETMAGWLKDMTLPDGYKPFDADFAPRMAKRLEKEGVEGVPTDANAARELFGVGWWKHDVAKAGELVAQLWQDARQAAELNWLDA